MIMNTMNDLKYLLQKIVLLGEAHLPLETGIMFHELLLCSVLFIGCVMYFCTFAFVLLLFFGYQDTKVHVGIIFQFFLCIPDAFFISIETYA
uniref:Uncharacterized protein n=1 Tax=Arundo donax TaxID=35708 RepID=A0A0A9A7U0_ARUDO